jgi:hypothetical protein
MTKDAMTEKSTGPLYAFGGAHPHALERNQDAMTGLATGKKVVREQDILTPQVVVDFVQFLWNDAIRMDPCATEDPRNVLEHVYDRVYALGDGLSVDWADRTYVNPPYKHLKAWMKKASEEFAKTGNRIAMLAPTRGHRFWWHEYRDTCSCVLELAPLKFIGYPGVFPAPLSLLLWGDTGTPDDLARALVKSGLRTTKVTYL